jgi:hypothetical protein
MANEQQDQGNQPRGAENMERMREGGYGSDRNPVTPTDGAMAGRGSGPSAESVAYTGAHDLTRGASEGADSPVAESDAERKRREEAEQIGE